MAVASGDNGWDASAEAWLATMGSEGDWGRVQVLDPAIRTLLAGRQFRSALDVGCGEGRFCRMLRDWGVSATGVEPTAALLRAAQERDPNGEYQQGRAEAMDFPDDRFDLVVSYLTLIDIANFRAALREMARVLKPGGSLLIANLSGLVTSCAAQSWVRDRDGTYLHYPVDRYLEERSDWISWGGIRIRNWHRPLSAYMTELLELRLQLRHFAEPVPIGGEPDRAARYRRAPWFLLMEWQKPAR